MSAIYEEVVLEWHGEEYTVQPDYRMVQEIERRGISILNVCERLQRGEPQLSLIAEIISHMLQSGGARSATPERVYAHMMSGADAKEGNKIALALLTAFIPQEPDPGNSEGPADGAEHLTEATTEKPPPT